MTIPTPTKARGSYLYKYSSPVHLEWLKTIILEHELYLPSLDQLNDPTDGRPRLAPLPEDQMVSFLHNDFLRRHPDLTREARDRDSTIIRFNVRRYGVEAIQRILTQSLNAELEGYRIYSLSKRYDNLSLWAKYAAGHSGYCLEFANDGPFFEYAKEVEYGDSALMDLTNRDDRNGYWFFRKKQEWSNEEEVRLVLARGKGSKVEIDPRWLTRLILGWHMSDVHRTLIREWAKQREPELTVACASYDELDQTLRLIS
jgi:hypothetical protein